MENKLIFEQFISELAKKYNGYCSNNPLQIGYPGNHQQHNIGRECWPMDNAILWCDNIYWACKDSDSKFMIILEEDSFILKPISIIKGSEFGIAGFEYNTNVMPEILLDVIKQIGGNINIPLNIFGNKGYGASGGFIIDCQKWIISWEKFRHILELNYDKLKFNNIFKFNAWKLAMIPSSEGFNDYNRWDEFTFKLNDIVSSTWHIKQNHHYFKYQELTGKSINDFDRIVEFGGGCGDMCKFIKQMGFKGEYVIIDLPEIHEIQKNNLSTYYDVKFETNPVEKNNKRTLFIATWSISETTLQLRNEIINRLKPEEYLIVYQRQFEDISNENWFKNWDGHREELPWIVWDGGSQYILK